jgi:beta-glucanase (GH16 family)
MSYFPGMYPAVSIVSNDQIGQGPFVDNTLLVAPATMPIQGGPLGWQRVHYDDWSTSTGHNGTGIGTRYNAEYVNRARFLNDEIQYYLDPIRQPGFGPQDIHTVATSGSYNWLKITATVVNAGLTATYQNRKYISGLISDWGFGGNQVYGYWECRVKYPNIKGIWPAFWTLTEDSSWPPEIDGLEWPNNQVDSSPTRYFVNLHWVDTSRPTRRNASGGWFTVAGNLVSGAYISFLWTEKFIAYYCNGVRFRQTTNPVDNGIIRGVHKSQHIAINLALGGAWATTPSPAAFPVTMKVTNYSRWAIPS